MSKVENFTFWAALFVMALFIFLVGGWLALLVRAENLEAECYQQVEATNGKGGGLVQISDEEKDSLGIDRGLTPARNYYEARKCVKRRRQDSFLGL